MTPEDVPEGPLLVDTDVFSDLYSKVGRHVEFAALIDRHPLAMSFASYGEALARGHVLHWGETRMSLLRLALRRFVILPYTAAVAEIWAPMHARLRDNLHGQGTNDLWTAACALAQPERPAIVTNNLGDFQRIAEHFEIRLVHPDLDP